jgi:hypothetical protein
MSRFRGHLTYANVTATLALLVALGGGSAYAVNEWTGANIQDETITGADIRGKPALDGVPMVQGSIRGEDIRDVSLTGKDLAVGTIGTSRVLDDTLTGDDIDESTFRGVPGKPIRLRFKEWVQSGDKKTTNFPIGPWTVSVSCEVNYFSGNPELRVTARGSGSVWIAGMDETQDFSQPVVYKHAIDRGAADGSGGSILGSLRANTDTEESEFTRFAYLYSDTAMAQVQFIGDVEWNAGYTSTFESRCSLVGHAVEVG